MSHSTEAKVLQLVADLPALALSPAAIVYQAAVSQHAFRETQLADLIERDPGSPIIPTLKAIQLHEQERLDRMRALFDQAVAIHKATELRLRKMGAILPPPSLKSIS